MTDHRCPQCDAPMVAKNDEGEYRWICTNVKCRFSEPVAEDVKMRHVGATTLPGF